LGGLLNLPSLARWNSWLETFAHWLEHSLGELVHPEQLTHAGEFVPLVAALSTVIAIISIFLGWQIYRASRYETFWAIPAARRGDDPLRGILGPLFEALKNKWWIDELYELVTSGHTLPCLVSGRAGGLELRTIGSTTR
jgi:hypothetical protein